MEQLVFELAPPEPQRFSNFLAGRNDELLAALTRFAEGRDAAPGVLVWGASGAGKTHLLRAAVALGAARGVGACYYPEPKAVPAEAGAEGYELVAVDRVDEADPGSAARIFTAYNALAQRGGRMLAASRLPLTALPLREDLRTRLGWGLVYEVLPLADEDKPVALAGYARERGFELAEDVIDYLLRHGRRDMGSLLAALAALDRLSLAAKRAITVPLLRDWLQATLDVEDRSSGSAADG